MSDVEIFQIEIIHNEQFIISYFDRELRLLKESAQREG